jgi:IS30 family transposase
MSTAESDVEEQVRTLAAAKLSTRAIAKAIDVSQSTVARTLRRINTGPQPVLAEEENSRSQRRPVTMEMVRLGVLIVAVLALVVLTAAVATIAWR